MLPEFAEVKAINWKPLLKEFPHLEGVSPPEPFEEGECGLLIGNNCARLIAPQKTKTINENNVPVAHYTRLGWSIAGPSSPVQSTPWASEALMSLEEDLQSRLREYRQEKL